MSLANSLADVIMFPAHVPFQGVNCSSLCPTMVFSQDAWAADLGDHTAAHQGAI